MTKRSLTVGSLKNGMQGVLSKMEVHENLHSQPQKQGQSQIKAPVQIIQNQTTYSVSPQNGKTLLAAALDQNQPLEYKCTKGTCGRCTVRIVSGGDSLSTINEREQEKLKDFTRERYRLACQAVF